MRTTSDRFGWYLAALQLFFTLCWTVYALYLPQLAATAGIAAGAVILILMLDQAVFTVCDFLTGIATDRVTRTLGHIGPIVAAVTVVSCLAFVAMPLVAPAGAAAFIAVTMLWTITSSALRAPPLMLLGKYAAKPSLPIWRAWPCWGSASPARSVPISRSPCARSIRAFPSRWPAWRWCW